MSEIETLPLEAHTQSSLDSSVKTIFGSLSRKLGGKKKKNDFTIPEIKITEASPIHATVDPLVAEEDESTANNEQSNQEITLTDNEASSKNSVQELEESGKDGDAESESAAVKAVESISGTTAGENTEESQASTPPLPPRRSNKEEPEKVESATSPEMPDLATNSTPVAVQSNGTSLFSFITLSRSKKKKATSKSKPVTASDVLTKLDQSIGTSDDVTDRFSEAQVGTESAQVGHAETQTLDKSENKKQLKGTKKYFKII